MPTRAEIALDFFRRRLGLTPAQAAGLVGNLQQESGPDINPTQLGDGGRSFGAFQFLGPRRRALNAFAVERGTDPSDFNTQLEFAAREFETTERRAFDRLRAATTPAEAAVAAQTFFRPGDPRTENRIRNAIRLAGGPAVDINVRPVRTEAITPQTATAGRTSAISPSAPAPQQQPIGLLADAGGAQTGNAGNVRGLLGDPLLNIGLGLLAASQPSTAPVQIAPALISSLLQRRPLSGFGVL